MDIEQANPVFHKDKRYRPTIQRTPSAANIRRAQHGDRVTIVTRDAKRAAAWCAKGAELAEATVEDVPSLRAAFRRGKRAFLLNPSADTSTDTDAVERRTVANILAALMDSGLEKVVAQSTGGARPGDRIGDLSVLWELEEGLRRQSIPAAINRGAYYMTARMDEVVTQCRRLQTSALPEDAPALGFRTYQLHVIGLGCALHQLAELCEHRLCLLALAVCGNGGSILVTLDDHVDLRITRHDQQVVLHVAGFAACHLFLHLKPEGLHFRALAWLGPEFHHHRIGVGRARGRPASLGLGSHQRQREGDESSGQDQFHVDLKYGFATMLIG